MTERFRLGMLTPSSNTVLEPVTTAMLDEIPEASAHFGRFEVTEIALSQKALAQFDTAGILQAARLLAHARCQVIAWNGTSSGWLGFDADRRLCAAIEEATGAKACTSVLALNELLAQTGIKRIGLVTPYVPEVQWRIMANYAALGVQCVAERHLGLSENYAFSDVDPGELQSMVKDVVADGLPRGLQAVVVFCTNLRAAPSAARWGGIL